MNSATSLLQSIERQPDFPDCDLTEQNASVLPHVLEKAGIEGYARFLERHQQSVYALSVQALEILGIKPVTSIDDFSPEEYRSFTEGFATFEAFQMAVQQKRYDEDRAIQRAHLLYIAAEPVADLELSQRVGHWLTERPNTGAAIVETGDMKGESHEQLRARTLGAQIAFELQRPILDIVS